MKIPLTGGCACGAVRYECAAAPIAMFNCHCRSCQQVSGGPYTPVVLLPSNAFRITKGSLRHHLLPSERSGQHKRGFCADCGSRITGGESTEPRDWVGVTASSLDDPSAFRPTFDIFVSSAQPWDLLDPKIAKHAKYPPR
jgi:hypothetical protein